MALTHLTIAHPAPAIAAQSITTRLVGPLPLEAIPTTLPWERTHPPKQGKGRDKGTGKGGMVARKDLSID